MMWFDQFIFLLCVLAVNPVCFAAPNPAPNPAGVSNNEVLIGLAAAAGGIFKYREMGKKLDEANGKIKDLEDGKKGDGQHYNDDVLDRLTEEVRSFNNRYVSEVAPVLTKHDAALTKHDSTLADLVDKYHRLSGRVAGYEGAFSSLAKGVKIDA